MSDTNSIAQLKKLSVAERLQLMEDVWVSLDGEIDEMDTNHVPDWHRSELDDRLTARAADPTQVLPWVNVLEALRAGLRK